MTTWPPTPDWLQLPADLNALDVGLWPEDTHRCQSGQMMISGCSVIDLINTFGSPVLVMSEDDFRARAGQFRSSFSGWDMFYAGKALLTKTIARWVLDEGLNLDVCSGNELAIAQSAGFPAERIGFHGNNKSVDELHAAISSGVGRIIVDSNEEITRIEEIASSMGRTVDVLLRVTTGVSAHTHEYISTGHDDQKFGFSVASGTAIEALVRCEQSPWIDLRGVHSHIGSQIFGTDAFDAAANTCMKLLSDFRDRTGVTLGELDLGGGFGISYTPADTPLSPQDLHTNLVEVIDRARLRWNLGEIRMSIEPGRAIVGPAGVCLYTVGTVKPVELDNEAYRVYVSVDGGMSDNIRPALYGADYTAVLANRVSSEPPMLVRVVGKHCESGDILVRDGYLPSDTHPGDILAVASCGAYTRSMASNYNATTKLPIVAVSEGHPELIVRRETLDDLLRLDLG